MPRSSDRTTNMRSKIQTSDFYRAVFMNSKQNSMILMDKEGYILQSNKAFETNFGYTQHDLAGKHTRMFFTIEDQNLKKPEIEIATVKEQGSADDNNYLVHKDGSMIWVMGESTLIETEKETYITKIIHNIHTQKVMERFLTESNELVESVLKTIKEALVVVDHHLRILKANRSFYQTFEIPQETIEGILLYDLNYAFWNEHGMQSKLETMIEENDFFQTGQFQWRKPDGNSRIFNVTARNMDHSVDKTKRILIVISDVTVEKELEQQKEDLIGFVTHEVRNPLANMTLCAELMEDSIKYNKIEESEEYLQKMRTNIRRLSSVVSELHDATKAGSGMLQINKEQIRFEELVDDAIETVMHLYPHHDIEKTGNAPMDVWGDRHLLLQVLTNYLTNAIKYSQQADRVNIHLSTTEESLITSVTDYGNGIPPSKIPHIFNRYYRVENSTVRDGLGLGLYISKEIVNAHNGKVWVESEENVGSTFYFSLPLK